MLLLTFLSALGTAQAWAADGDPIERLVDGLKAIQDERWSLALEQARIELDARLITPDRLITRAREIMVEQWGTPEERARLADKQKEKELHGRIESQIGATNLMIWKRLAHEPGACWTRTQEGGIIIKDIHGVVTVLHHGHLPMQAPAGDPTGALLYTQALAAGGLQLLTPAQVCVPPPPPPPPAPVPRPWWDIDMGSSTPL